MYLWFVSGEIRTASGRVIGHADTLTEAAEQFPDATFRIRLE